MTGKKTPAWTEAALRGADVSSVEITHVAVEDLHTPAEYQRALDLTRVQRMARAYDARLVGTIVVSRRPDGTLMIVDGQHRVEMLRLLGVAAVRAEVHDGLSVIDEAHAFEGLNTLTRRPRQFDLFRARVTGERPETMRIVDLAAEYGYDFREAAGRSGSHIAAVGAVETIYGYDGGQTLRRVFQVTSGPWAGRPDALEGQMLRGLAQFLRADMGVPVDMTRLLSVLAKTPPERVRVEALGLALRLGSGGSTASTTAWVLTLRDVYNRGLGSTSRLRLGFPRVNDRRLPSGRRRHGA